MSIATDEAEEKIERIPCIYNSDDLRKAYVAGRTAGPTEAEIEAADKALLQAFRDNSNMLVNKESVHIVLEAARKAVTE